MWSNTAEAALVLDMLKRATTCTLADVTVSITSDAATVVPASESIAASAVRNAS
jgi:hypothetical protein